MVKGESSQQEALQRTQPFHFMGGQERPGILQRPALDCDLLSLPRPQLLKFLYRLPQ